MISVVIPVHDPGPLLLEALNSVIGQTHSDWEAVVVDDGSSEDLSWVDRMDERVRLLQTPQRGVSVARNTGVSATTGEFVAFLDQDDRWHPHKLERQLVQLAGGAMFSSTAFDLIDGAGRRTGPGYGRPVSYLDMLAGEFGVLQSSVAVRRDALEAAGAYNPLLAMQQDLDLVLRLARAGRTAYCDTVEVDYRIHPGNASRNYWRASRELRHVYDLHELVARADGDGAALEALARGRRAVSRTYAYQAIDAARQSLHGGRVRESGVALGRSMQLSPSVVARSAKSLVQARARRLAPSFRAPRDDDSPRP